MKFPTVAYKHVTYKKDTCTSSVMIWLQYYFGVFGVRGVEGVLP